MGHTAAKSSALVFYLSALHFHKKGSHGFSRYVCSWVERLLLGKKN